MRRRHLGAIVAIVLIAVLAPLASPSVAAQEPTEPPTTEGPGTTEPTTTTTAPTTTTTAPTTTEPTERQPPTTAPAETTDPATPTTAPERGAPGSDEAPAPPTQPGGPAEGTDPTATTLPSGPPPGFTEEQFATFVNVVTVCGADPGLVCTRLLAWTGNEALAETAQWIVDLPLRFALVIVLALLANRVVRRLIATSSARWTRRSATGDEDGKVHARHALRVATASSTLASAATVIIYTVAAFAALWQLDIDLAPLFAGAGIAGIALGFGAQNLVRDMLAGFFVIVEDQYGIGDTIDFGKATGVVEDITLRVTKVRDVEGTLWFVPNGIIAQVGNMSQRWARVILDVDVAYSADHHEAGRVIKEAADELWNDPDSEISLLEEPELWGVERLGESSVVIRLAIKCAPAKQWAAARELRSRIKDRFDAAGIEVLFPQQEAAAREEEAAGEEEAAATSS